MARYHINPHTGNPGVCQAKRSCPYGDLTSDHFDSKADARKAYESGKLDKAFSTLKKTTDEVLDQYMAEDEDSAITSDEAILEAIEKAGWPTIEPVADSELMGPDQIAHKVGDLFVSTRNAPSMGARGQVEVIVETMVIGADGEILDTQTTRDLDEDVKAEQHAKALDWAATNYASLRATEGSTILTDETMQEMDSYYTDHPAIFVNDDYSGGEKKSVIYANNEYALATKDERVVEAMKLASSSGVWREIQGSPIEAKYTHFTRLVNKTEDWLKDDILDKQDFIEAHKDDETSEMRDRVDFERRFLALNYAALKAQEYRKSTPELPDELPPF